MTPRLDRRRLDITPALVAFAVALGPPRRAAQIAQDAPTPPVGRPHPARSTFAQHCPGCRVPGCPGIKPPPATLPTPRPHGASPAPTPSSAPRSPVTAPLPAQPGPRPAAPPRPVLPPPPPITPPAQPPPTPSADQVTSRHVPDCPRLPAAPGVPALASAR